MQADQEVEGLAIRPLTPAVGAEISGLDLADLTDRQFALVAEAFDRYAGLLFRDQKLSPDDLVAFSRRWGELDVAPVMENGRTAVPGYPEIYIVSNVKDADGKPIGSLGAGEAVWHTDMSYLPSPPYASLLYAIEVPPSGGDTSLCGMKAAYDSLPPALRERIAGLEIKHDGTYNSGGYLREGVTASDDPVTSVGQVHPAVCRHPATGDALLYLGRRRNAYVMGLDLDDSERLLDELWDYAVRPEHTYTHHWRVGDVLLWDNRATMHRRDPFDASARRLMQRTQIRGKTQPRAAVDAGAS